MLRIGSRCARDAVFALKAECWGFSEATPLGLRATKERSDPCKRPERSNGRRSRGVWADQRQVEPWPGNQWNAGVVIAPAKLETVACVLNRDGFPPGTPLAVVFGQDEVAEVDGLPIVWQGLRASSRILGGRFALLLYRDSTLVGSRSPSWVWHSGTTGQAYSGAGQAAARVGNRAIAM